MKPVKKLVAGLMLGSSVLYANYTTDIRDPMDGGKKYYYVCPNDLYDLYFASSELQVEYNTLYDRLYNRLKDRDDLENAAKMKKVLKLLDDKKGGIKKFLFNIDKKIYDTICTSYDPDANEAYKLEPKLEGQAALDAINKIMQEDYLDKIQVKDNSLILGK